VHFKTAGAEETLLCFVILTATV